MKLAWRGTLGIGDEYWKFCYTLSIVIKFFTNFVKVSYLALCVCVRVAYFGLSALGFLVGGGISLIIN